MASSSSWQEHWGPLKARWAVTHFWLGTWAKPWHLFGRWVLATAAARVGLHPLLPGSGLVGQGWASRLVRDSGVAAEVVSWSVAGRPDQSRVALSTCESALSQSEEHIQNACGLEP